MTEVRPGLRYRLRAILARSLLYLFAGLPLWLSHAMGSLLGRVGNRVNNEVRYAARINIRLCLPELSAQQQRRLVRRYMIETGKTLFETSALWLWSGRRILRLVRAVSGEELVSEARQAGKGVIFAMPHLGAWEMAALYCSSRYPMTTLYRPPHMQAMDTVIRQGRERFGATLMPTDNRGVKALLTALSRGETIGILPDQEPAQGQGVFAPFFGIPSYSMSLLSRLAHKTDAVVVFAYAERLSRGRGYHIHFLPAPADIESPVLETSVAAVNAGVEQCIQACPQQYQWGYRRFKTRPEGESGFY